MPKPKLTPEERKHLRIAKRAEKKRLAALKKKQQKVDHLEREVKYGNLTVKRHEKKWRAMLLRIALPRMREDLQYAWHNFERVIDAKDFTISLLMDEIRDAEEQYMMNLKSHVENIDSLIDNFKIRVKELRENGERDIAELTNYAASEADGMQAVFKDGEDCLKTMLYGLEMIRKAQEKKGRGELLSKIDEEDTKYTDIVQRMRAALETKLVHLWDKTDNFLEEYYKRTDSRKAIYLELAEEDAILQTVLSRQLITINASHDFIKILRERYAKVVKQKSKSIADLENEKNFLTDSFNTLKLRLEGDLGVDSDNIKYLTSNSNSAIEFLKDLKQKGRRILKMMGICRQLETEKEKILGFPEAQIPKLLGKSIIDLRSLDMEHDDLHMFWCKVAMVDTHRYSMNEEREFLRRENRLLKLKIHKFCECLDCPALPPIAIKKSFHITDVNSFMKKYSMSKINL